MVWQFVTNKSDYPEKPFDKCGEFTFELDNDISDDIILKRLNGNGRRITEATEEKDITHFEGFIKAPWIWIGPYLPANFMYFKLTGRIEHVKKKKKISGNIEMNYNVLYYQNLLRYIVFGGVFPLLMFIIVLDAQFGIYEQIFGIVFFLFCFLFLWILFTVLRTAQKDKVKKTKILLVEELKSDLSEV